MKSQPACKILIWLSVALFVIAISPMSSVLALTSPTLPPVPKILFGGGYQGPNAYRTGPPIASCNAEFHQGPPDDSLRGCFDSPVDTSQP
jgi:hypothetical protein